MALIKKSKSHSKLYQLYISWAPAGYYQTRISLTDQYEFEEDAKNRVREIATKLLIKYDFGDPYDDSDPKCVRMRERLERYWDKDMGVYVGDAHESEFGHIFSCDEFKFFWIHIKGRAHINVGYDIIDTKCKYAVIRTDDFKLATTETTTIGVFNDIQSAVIAMRRAACDAVCHDNCIEGRARLDKYDEISIEHEKLTKPSSYSCIGDLEMMNDRMRFKSPANNRYTEWRITQICLEI